MWHSRIQLWNSLLQDAPEPTQRILQGKRVRNPGEQGCRALFG